MAISLSLEKKSLKVIRSYLKVACLLIVFFTCSCDSANLIQIRPETARINSDYISDNRVWVKVFSEAIVIKGNKPDIRKLKNKIISSTFESWCIDTETKLNEIYYDSGPGDCSFKECFMLVTEFELIFKKSIKFNSQEKPMPIGKLEIELKAADQGDNSEPIKYEINLELK